MIDNVFVVIPAYNAAATIEGVVDRVPAQAYERISRFVVVDDGSTDDTAAVLRRLEQREPKLTVLRHDRNRGYGATERTLLDHAVVEGADVAIVLHADGQYSPEKIPAILDVFDRDRADLVQGSRMLGGGALEGGMPRYKYLANRSLTFIENVAFRMRLAEYHSGYMSYSRQALTSLPYDRLSDSFDFDLEMIVLANVAGLRIAEVPIPTIYADEESHLNPITYGLRVLRVVGRYLTGYYRRLLDSDS